MHDVLAISTHHVSHKAFPSSPQQAGCPLTHKPSHQLLRFLALVHPLHPAGLFTSDPRRWVSPFCCLPLVHLPCPLTQKGEMLGLLEGGALLSKADASVQMHLYDEAVLGVRVVRVTSRWRDGDKGSGSRGLVNAPRLGASQRGFCSSNWSSGLRSGPQLIIT